MSKFKEEAKASIVVALTASLLISSLSVLMLAGSVQASSGFKLKWVANLGLATYIGPLAAHIIPGAKDMQIVVTGVGKANLGWTNGSIALLNGSTGSVIWKQNVGNIQDHSPFEIADLNSDGNMEIITANLGNTLVLYGNNGTTYWKNTAAPSYVNYPVVADVDGDGYPEVFVTSGYGPWRGVDYTTELSHDGRILAQTTSWHPCWGGLAVGDPYFNGTFILVQGDRSIWYNPDSDPYKNGGWGVRVLDAKTLNPIWNDSSVLTSSSVLMLVDVNRDGVLELVAQNQSNGLAVYNALNGSILSNDGIYRANGSLGLNEHSQPTIYFDANEHPQIIVNHDSNPQIWDLKNWKLTATLPVTAGEPPKMGRVTADQQMDIIAVDNAGVVHVYSQNFTEVDNITGLSNPNPFTLVQDVDGDGYNELVLTSRSGYVYAYSTRALASTPAPRSTNAFYSEYRLGVAEYVDPPGPKTPLIVLPTPANGSTGVSIHQSTLSFNLTDYQDYPMNYTVTTNPNVGGGTGTNVRNGRYSISINGLEYLTTYSWTVSATDGRVPNVTTFTFTTEESPSQQQWWDAAWQYRMNVTIDHTKVAAGLTNFPVLVDITSTSLANHAQTSGNDIVFIDSSGNKLNHEIESYKSASGHLIAWVMIPSLSSTSDTVLSMYYGNPSSTNQQNAKGVWDSNFLMVQHLNATSTTQIDSTSRNNGTITGAVNPGVPGKIGGADNFTSGYVTLPTVLSSQTRLTFSAWVYALSGARYFISEWASNNGAFLQVSGDSVVQMYVNGIMVQLPVSLNQWHFVVGTYNGTTASLWIDGGSPANIAASAPVWPNQNMYLGNRYDLTRQFIGLLDEVRVSSVARSNGWINTEYINQNTPSAFYTVGQEEFRIAHAPIVSSLSPPDGDTGVDVTLSSLSFNLTSYQDAPTNYTVVTTPDVGADNGTNVTSGVYFVPIGGLNYSTTYSWQVNVTDGTYWTNKTFQFTTKPPPPSNWYNSSWQYRMNITLSYTQVNSTLTNYPLLVDLTNSALINSTQTNGQDFVFTDVNNTKLDHQIEYYNSITGHLTAWVRIPLLSTTTDTTIFMYYGNPTIPDQQNTTGVWDSNYLAVLHLNDGPTQCNDSTTNGNNGTLSGNVTQLQGKIGGAYSFTGGNVTLPRVLTSQTQFTFSAWIFAQSGARYFISEWSPTNNQGAFVQVAGDSQVQMYINGIMVSQPVSLNQWHYVVGTFDGTTASLWVDGGSPASVSAATPIWPSQNMFLGNRADGQRAFNGLIDEVRVSNIARSNDWVNTEYINQNTPLAFYTVGPQESFSP